MSFINDYEIDDSCSGKISYLVSNSPTVVHGTCSGEYQARYQMIDWYGHRIIKYSLKSFIVLQASRDIPWYE